MALPRIAVEIDHSRLVPLVTLERGGSGSIDLTTIVERQQRAVIRLFLLSDAAPKLLTTVSLEHLDQTAQRRPVLRLDAAIRGRHATCTVMVDGTRASRTRIDVADWLPSRNYGAIVAVAALLLLLLIGGGWLIQGMLRPAGPVVTSAPAAPPAVATRPAPAQPPVTPPAVVSPAPGPAETAAPEPPPVVTPPETETTTPPAVSPAPAETAPPRTVEPAPSPAPPTAAIVGQQQRTVYFLPDSNVLTATARRELQQIAEWLGDLPRENIEVRIEGHCAPAGSERGRLELSRQRARAVEQFLRSAGWSPARAPLVEGFSSDRPVSQDPEQQHLNRRVEVIVLAGN
ncbi:MAG: OmpA family protein [Spirochaetaceae bacterium]|nr:MAG: OmpA family protein [Spirochaetaceae bacterium]